MRVVLDPPRWVAYQAGLPTCRAAVAELVDALASGASGGNPVEVRVFSAAPFSPYAILPPSGWPGENPLFVKQMGRSGLLELLRIAMAGGDFMPILWTALPRRHGETD